jgi:hypothetical protein
MKTRIVVENWTFYPEYKGWFFWHRFKTCIFMHELSITSCEDISYPTLVETEAFLVRRKLDKETVFDRNRDKY